MAQDALPSLSFNAGGCCQRPGLLALQLEVATRSITTLKWGCLDILCILSGARVAAVARWREESLTLVRECVRYLQARREQLGYTGALAAGLPIGSGLIESGHRHVVQARLKKLGAWWYDNHTRAMLALRVTRANGDWTRYCQSLN
jgi:hypothetical protein